MRGRSTMPKLCRGVLMGADGPRGLRFPLLRQCDCAGAVRIRRVRRRTAMPALPRQGAHLRPPARCLLRQRDVRRRAAVSELSGTGADLRAATSGLLWQRHVRWRTPLREHPARAAMSDTCRVDAAIHGYVRRRRPVWRRAAMRKVPRLAADLCKAAIPMLRQRRHLRRGTPMRDLSRVAADLRAAARPLLRERRTVWRRSHLRDHAAGPGMPSAERGDPAKRKMRQRRLRRRPDLHALPGTGADLRASAGTMLRRRHLRRRTSVPQLRRPGAHLRASAGTMLRRRHLRRRPCLRAIAERSRVPAARRCAACIFGHVRGRGPMRRGPAMRKVPRLTADLCAAAVPMLRQRRRLRRRARLCADGARRSGLRQAIAIDAIAIIDTVAIDERSDTVRRRDPGHVPVALGSGRRLVDDRLGTEPPVPRLHPRHQLQLRRRELLRQLPQRSDHDRLA